MASHPSVTFEDILIQSEAPHFAIMIMKKNPNSENLQFNNGSSGKQMNITLVEFLVSNDMTIIIQMKLAKNLKCDLGGFRENLTI